MEKVLADYARLVYPQFVYKKRIYKHKNTGQCHMSDGLSTFLPTNLSMMEKRMVIGKG